MAITIYINASSHSVNPSPTQSLASLLRSLSFTGTKIGCNEGGCGACTVLLTPEGEGPRIVNACLKLAASCHGCHVLTTEGLGGRRTTFHDIQRVIADNGGSQCGFCTPGWVMSMAGFLTSGEPQTKERLESWFDGNLCRCTGFRPIIEGFRKLLNEGKPGCTGSCESCTACDEDHHSGKDSDTSCCGGLGDIEDLCCRSKKVDSTNEDSPSKISNPQGQTIHLLTQVPKSLPVEATIVAGNTGAGVTKYYNGTAPFNRALYSDNIYDISSIAQLKEITFTPTSITVGSGVTITELIKTLKSPTIACELFDAASRHLQHVATHQVRNLGTWAGNLAIARTYSNFPSDVVLTLSALNATITCTTIDGEILTNVPVLAFIGTASLPVRLILSATIPLPTAATYSGRFKLTQRRVNAHAHVNLFATASKSSSGLSDARVVIGGATRVTSLLPLTSAAIKGKVIVSEVVKVFQTEISNIGFYDDPQNPPEYLLKAATGCIVKYLLGLPEELPRPVSTSLQSYSINPESLPVTAPVPKVNSRLQASGDAMYCQDHPAALHGAFIYSTKVGIFNSFKVPGGTKVISARDVTGDNTISTGERLFLPPGEVAGAVGVPLGLVLASTAEEAREIAANTMVSYGETPDPVAYDLATAMKIGSTFDIDVPTFRKGNPDTATAPRTLSGRIATGAQKHFYFETHSCVSSVDEDGVIVRSSCQGTTNTQSTVASVLGLPANEVSVKQKRAGGGYGGKLTRHLPTACAASLAALVTGQSVSVIQDRNTDMSMIGGREAMVIDYTAGFDDEGLLQFVKLHLHVDAGYTIDASAGSLGMALKWSDHAYCTPNFQTTATLYKTNTGTNTSCRSPGNMQSCMGMEDIVLRIAAELNLPVEHVQEINFYKTGDVSPLGGLGSVVNLQRCWRELHAQAEVAKKRDAIETFNKENRFQKRGLHIVPCKYGMSGDGYKQLARVAVYASDGTVHISHSGCEIGQGIDTKAAQVAAMKLGVDMDKIRFRENDSFIAANTGLTGGSATSEVVCGAIIKACDTILKRLEQFRNGGDGDQWLDVVQRADDAGINLSAEAWNNPVLNPLSNNGTEFQYYVWCAACVVIELDVLTGEVVVLSADIQYDCGEQLNAEVDIGQIEGAFIMGQGYFLTETVGYDDNGLLINNGTWEYKPPSALDIPVNFNVRLLRNACNTESGNVLRSKATGEPPMVASAATWFAVRDAILRAQRDFGSEPNKENGWNLAVPATPAARIIALGNLSI